MTMQPAENDPGRAQEEALATLPPTVATVWSKFAQREIGKGRRDVSHLVEATLQFMMDQNARALQPLVTTLENLNHWAKAIDTELGRMALVLHRTTTPTLAHPYQRVTITLDKKSNGTSEVSSSEAGGPTSSRAELQTYHATMQKQRHLVERALTEQTQAVVTRRQQMADALRSYSDAMHKSAMAMIEKAPPPPPPKAKTLKIPTQDLLTAPLDAPMPTGVFPTLALAVRNRGTLFTHFKTWLGQKLSKRPPNPFTFIKSCYQALIRGYRSDPYTSIEDDFPLE